MKVPDDAFGVCAIGETKAFDVENVIDGSAV